MITQQKLLKEKFLRFAVLFHAARKSLNSNQNSAFWVNCFNISVVKFYISHKTLRFSLWIITSFCNVYAKPESHTVLIDFHDKNIFHESTEQFHDSANTENVVQSTQR